MASINERSMHHIGMQDSSQYYRNNASRSDVVMCFVHQDARTQVEKAKQDAPQCKFHQAGLTDIKMSVLAAAYVTQHSTRRHLHFFSSTPFASAEPKT